MESIPRRGGKACGAQPAKAHIPSGWRSTNLMHSLRLSDPLADIGVLAIDKNLPLGRFRFSAFPPRHKISLPNFRNQAIWYEG